ncbi:MAG: CehA/McbA family metallohydrolase, partial [Chitinophagaceae bacterium]
MIKKQLLLFLFAGLYLPILFAQHTVTHSSVLEIVTNVEPQPLLAQAIRLNDALSFLGSSLSKENAKRLKELQDKPLTEETSKLIQIILDPYCLAMVDINPEVRVKVLRGPSAPILIQGGWTSFLVKVHNQAGVTAKLNAESSNAEPLLHMDVHMDAFPPQSQVSKENLLTAGQIANRFLEIQVYHNRPLSPNLSGLALEYAVVQIYCKDAGQREVEIGFNIGQGTQDIGFRNAINILFTIRPSVKVVLHVKDDDSSPTMASFVITDGIERIIDYTVKAINSVAIDYRFTKAQLEFWELWIPSADYKVPARLTGIYPLPSRRLASYDEYPDFFFQPQVYRSDGEHVLLPAGKYTVTFTRGPEYITQTKELVVPEGVDSIEATFQLKRWINMAKLGWYSADHHIHAAGCSHYESPEEGVKPVDMWRQVVGEDLNVAAVLAWGPGWYHQKDFFTGNINPLSTKKNLMRYDVEVSGFPSSHAGHVVLLSLKEDDYPGAAKIEDWPSWTLPVLTWAKSQGAVTGYAHSGIGLQSIDEELLFVPFTDRRNYQLPNYVTPKMDGIGANEYIVTVTQDAVDFYSAGNTPAPWELNMWYHT